MKNMFKLLLLLVIIIGISGCSHKSTVNPIQKKSNHDMIKLPYVIAIDGQDLKGKELNQSFNQFSQTINYGDSLLLSIKRELENHFKKVIILDSKTGKDYYDYKIKYNDDLQGRCYAPMSGCQYNSNTLITVYDNENNLILKKRITDRFNHMTPGSSHVLGALTGFTLLLISPITFPAMASIRGEELNKDLFNSQSRIVRKIGYELSDSKIFKSNNKVVKAISYNKPSINRNELDKLLFEIPEAKQDKKKWLFVIGIEQYEFTDNISYAKRSAEMFVKASQRTLGIPTENSYILIDNGATSTKIKTNLKKMLRRVKKGDSIYFYYNGHGIPVVSKKNEPYMLTFDTEPDFVADESFFSLQNIYSKLSNSKAAKVVAVVDSCFSGVTDGHSVLKGVAASRLIAKRVSFNKEKMVVLSAGKSNQYSNAYNRKGHRLFSFYIIKNMLEGDKDIMTLFGNTKRQTYDTSMKEFGDGRQQEPTIEGNFRMML